MTDFTPSEVELAKWLKDRLEDNDEDDAWLLTAKKLQKKLAFEKKDS